MVQIFDEVYDSVYQLRQNKLEGKVNSIVPPFPRLAEKYPGFEKGRYHIYTANSGVGKSKITKYLAVTSIANFIKENPSIKYKVFYFALEESVRDFWIGFLSTALYEMFNLEVSEAELKSLGKFSLSDDVMHKIQLCKDYIDSLSSCVEVIDYISNRTGIYKHVRAYAEANGEYIYENKTVTDNGVVVNKDVVVGYKPNNPDEYVFVVTDHVNLLQPEKGETLFETMGNFSKEYCLKGFCKRFNYIVINIQQQASDTEKQEFYKGQTIESKLEPSLSGLADNKTLQRDSDLVLGLFAPARYGLNTHRGYDITKLGDSYRSLIFLKDRRYGLANVYVPLYFNGKVGYFEELPKADQFILNPNLYETYVK